MKLVSIRTFLRNFYDVIGDLPLIVTKRGKPFLKVEKYEPKKEDELDKKNNK
jgi:hypothetical protein